MRVSDSDSIYAVLRVNVGLFREHEYYKNTVDTKEVLLLFSEGLDNRSTYRPSTVVQEHMCLRSQNYRFLAI